MKGTRMLTYTVSVTGAGRLARRFEQALDVLDAPALTGTADSARATLYFDVRARNRDRAIEKAWLRVQGFVPGEDVDIEVVSTGAVEGRESWLRRALSRR